MEGKSSYDSFVDREFNRVLGEYVRELRTYKGDSLQNLADKIDNIVTRQTLYSYEMNITRMKLNVFIEICHVYNVDPGEALKEINRRFDKYLVEYADVLLEEEQK